MFYQSLKWGILGLSGILSWTPEYGCACILLSTEEKKGGKVCVGYFALLAAFLRLVITIMIRLDWSQYGLDLSLRKY